MIKNIRNHIKELRRSNLIRHHYVCTPLLNYTQYGITKDCSYLDTDVLLESPFNSDFSTYDGISPIFTNFHQIVLHLYQKTLKDTFESKEIEKKILDITQIYETALKRYYEINIKPFGSNNKTIENENQFTDLFPIKLNDKGKINKNISKIKFECSKKAKELCIGLVNMQLNDSYIKKSYLQDANPNPKWDKDFRRLQKLVQLTQKQIDREIDVLILPELSVPFKALDALCDYAQREQILMIFGVEFRVCNNIVYNLVATLVPFNIKVSNETDGETIKGLFPIFRIKNHYAPEEKVILESYRYEIPELQPHEYFLIEWKDVHFSVFNCYELADIQHRALFRSLVDVLFACNYNLDTHYYSNIIESVVRDLHCYFVQSNNAEQGDSRITKPAKSTFMNQVQIKGGKNTSIIVDTIDIEAIRNFQIQNFVQHDRNLDFKPTPPGFDVENAMNRYGKQLNLKKIK